MRANRPRSLRQQAADEASRIDGLTAAQHKAMMAEFDRRISNFKEQWRACRDGRCRRARHCLGPPLVCNSGNAPWSKQPQMITAKHVEAQIELLPLLLKRFEVISFKLIGPTIALETDASGKGNWEFPSLSTAANANTQAPSGATLGQFTQPGISAQSERWRD